MKPGTLVKLPDGREGTVVYHGLDGYGVKWGRHHFDPSAIPANLFGEAPEDYEWLPDAMLRKPYPSAAQECVGDEWEIIREGDDGE